MTFLTLMLVMSMVTVEIVQPKEWWKQLTFIFTWPVELGKWIRINMTKEKQE